MLGRLHRQRMLVPRRVTAREFASDHSKGRTHSRPFTHPSYMAQFE